MTLLDVTSAFSTDERCRELLERLRWPHGPECPRCHSREVVRLSTNARLLWCSQCEHQFSVMAGTIFNDSHLALSKWFVATYLMCESRKGMSANQIKRVLGVSYKTAWYLCHRIRAAMATADKPMLSGTVEMDETYVGGRYHPHRETKPKEIVIGLRARGGDLRFFHAEDVKGDTLARYINEHISEDVDVIMTDEHPAYPLAMVKAGRHKNLHKTINHSEKVYARGDIHTNTAESAFSLLKRGIIGTWHRLSAKHLQAYLEEMTFRFNRRKRSDIFLDTLRHMVTADPLTFEKLTA
jgi:transposase-like protein